MQGHAVRGGGHSRAALHHSAPPLPARMQHALVLLDFTVWFMFGLSFVFLVVFVFLLGFVLVWFMFGVVSVCVSACLEFF